MKHTTGHRPEREIAMKDIYQEVTDRIIEELEQGIIPWERPWTGRTDSAISHVTCKPYSLINQILLKGRPGEYLTFKQCAAEGGHVKKGEKASMIVFWKMYHAAEKDEAGNIMKDADGKTIIKRYPVLRAYNVFHISQCEGIKAKRPEKELAEHAQPVEMAESIINDYYGRTGIKLCREISNQAYYSPLLDEVHVPALEQFPETAEYYSTLFHETVHSTGHKSRLDRFPENAADAAFGSENYSKEELVAEIGAACLNNYTGIETKHSFRNSAAYIQNWLSVLKNDTHMIVGAASRAEKAVDLILNQVKTEAEAEA